jgi:hypothetical protein
MIRMNLGSGAPTQALERIFGDGEQSFTDWMATPCLVPSLFGTG